MDFLCLKDSILKHRLRILLYSLVFGCFMFFLFSGKSRIDIETIAVSPDEQYIACFETGNGYKIRCFNKDGMVMFCYFIPADISAGGHCSLWFEDDCLCVQFYRTSKIAYFTMDGTILDLCDSANNEAPPKFASFSRKGSKYVYEGITLDIIYEKSSILGYWLFHSPRYLAITPQNAELKIVYIWFADENLEPCMD